MESESQLHPNWCALTAAYFPLKRFVRQQEFQSNEGNQNKVHSFLQREDGVEVQKFYEEITNKSTTNQAVITKPPEECLSIDQKSPALLKFDRVKFFRFATTNNIEELGKFDYQPNDVNSCDTFGWTALMMAACEGSKDAVRMLLQLGADKTIKEKRGMTALDIAEKKGYKDIAVLLKELDCNLLSDDENHSPAATSIEPFYCPTCDQTFSDTIFVQHQTSTIHQFNTKTINSQNKLNKFNISSKNRGLQLMVKQGWDKESGLGPTKDGRLYPIKTVIRKKRTGLGTDQEPARITHFAANDLKAVKYNNSNVLPTKKKRSRNDIRTEKLRERKRERRLRKELS